MSLWCKLNRQRVGSWNPQEGHDTWQNLYHAHGPHSLREYQSWKSKLAQCLPPIVDFIYSTFFRKLWNSWRGFCWEFAQIFMRYTPKINSLNPKSWRFGSDDLSFQLGGFLGSSSSFSGVYIINNYPAKNSSFPPHLISPQTSGANWTEQMLAYCPRFYWLSWANFQGKKNRLPPQTHESHERYKNLYWLNCSTEEMAHKPKIISPKIEHEKGHHLPNLHVRAPD